MLGSSWLFLSPSLLSCLQGPDCSAYGAIRLVPQRQVLLTRGVIVDPAIILSLSFFFHILGVLPGPSQKCPCSVGNAVRAQSVATMFVTTV